MGSGTATRRGISTRTLILALVAVIVLPGIAFTSFVLFRYAQSERARYELEARTVARASATAIDRELNGLMTTLQTLSTSAYLADDDLAGFYTQASRVKQFIDAEVGLRTPDGQQLVNTRLPWGTALPKTPLAVDAKVMASRQPAVSDVFRGPLLNRPLFSIVMPIVRNGEIKYLLHISSETARVAEIVQTVLSPLWLVGVGDNSGVFVARSERHEEFTGKPVVAAFVAQAKGAEGNFHGQSAFGEDVLVGYTRSSVAGWLVAANIQQSTIEAPLRQALTWLIGFGALALLVAAGLAIWLWRFISRPLGALASASRSMGQKDEFRDVRTPLREFAAVRDALAHAAETVRIANNALESKVSQRTSELAEANAELHAQIAARAEAESQIRQMQKMEAIGQLTGGIAHDFNNMLAIVISSLDLMQRRMAPGQEKLQKYIDAALDGARRAASLTSRLLAFSRQQPLAPDVVDVNRTVANMSELLQRTLGEAIRIETVLAAGLWKTHSDPVQMESAIINLAVNARDAMPDGGRLTIETANAFLDEAYALQHGAKAGQYVQLAITDTGGGMSAEVVDKAFDPFFTTKKVGMGTGLGLSQVYGFVKQSGGHIKIYSEPDQGTTIKVYLPRFYGQEEPRTVAQTLMPELGGHNGECILVVEDEDGVRALTAEALTELGYTVLQASGASVALEMLDKNQGVNLLFTDIVMPDTNGRKLAEEALKRNPKLKVLYTTGFTRNAVVHNGVLDAGVNFIAKPFAIEDLARKVRQVLANQ